MAAHSLIRRFSTSTSDRLASGHNPHCVVRFLMIWYPDNFLTRRIANGKNTLFFRDTVYIYCLKNDPLYILNKLAKIKQY